MIQLQEQLAAEGIILKHVKPGQCGLDCPKPYCRAARAGSDNECLKLDVQSDAYAEWKCRHCLWTGHIGEKPVVAESIVVLDSQAVPAGTIPPSHVELPGAAITILEGLGITQALALKHRLSWDHERNAIKFPYYDKGELINAMLMQIRDTGALVCRLASSQRIVFYGIDQVKDSKLIIIVQREVDRILLEACGFANVIALPNAGSLPKRQTDNYETAQDDFEYFSTCAESFAGVKEIIIAVDNTPEGEKFRYEIARRVGAGRCLNVAFSEQTLSATYLKRGMDDVCYDINSAQPYPITGLYKVADFEQSLIKYFEGGMASGVSTGWPNVDALYTVMSPELTVVTGVPNNGKSEWLDALTVNLALAHNWRLGVFSPENSKEQHVTKLVEKRVEMSADPKSKSRMSKETFYSGFSWVNDHYFFIVGDNEDELPTLDWIMEKAAAAILRYGIKGLIIDPWNEIEHVIPNGLNETSYISSALSKLKRFARNHAISVWVVAHPNKMQTDKEGNPVVPSLYDISGSAHWANKADNGIVIHRSASIDDATEVWVKKVRFKHVGKRGVTKLSYNLSTGRFSPLDLKPTYTFGNEGDTGIQTYEAFE